MSELSPRAKKIGAAGLVLAVLIPFSFSMGDIYVDPSDPGFGARDVPRLVIGLGMALCLLLLWSAWGGRDGMAQSLDGAFETLKGPTLVACIAFAYVWAVTAFQYALPTFVLLALLSWYFGCRGWRDLVVIPAIAVTLYYAIFFVLLGIYEEPGSILSYDSYGVSRTLRQAIGLN